MAERTCFNCLYCVCDPCLWLRLMAAGEQILPRCANHPLWRGQLHEVPGVPCRHYRPRPPTPEGDGVRMIPLMEGGYAYVDAADYEWLNQWRWRLLNGYAGRLEKGKIILMHRVIMQPPEGKVVDHADGNKVDNCRVNLRVCTPGENTHNQHRRCTSSSTYKGIRYSKRLRKWYARCRYQGERYVRGYFDTEMEAARAYDWLAVTLFGEFARLNFPREWPPERRAEAVAHRQELLGKVKVRKPRKVRGTVERGTVARLVTADVRRPTKRASPPPDDPATSEGKKVRKANRRGE